jgi:hypothetical protein
MKFTTIKDGKRPFGLTIRLHHKDKYGKLENSIRKFEMI